MTLEIRWTQEAQITFENIVNYLQSNWSDREVGNSDKHDEN